jgi:hypothetical protein
MTMHQHHRRQIGTEQLSFQPPAHVPVPAYRRLDARTRRIGLAGVAEAKAHLDGRSARKAA